METSAAQSIPEPPPRNEGEDVPTEFIKWLIRKRDNRSLSLESVESLVQLTLERRSFGIQKYGQPLMTGDGRDEVEDARQEAGDLLVYLMKAKMNKRDPEQVKRIFSSVIDAIFELLVDM